MLTINQKMNLFRLFMGVMSLAVTAESTYHVEREPTCDCVCRDSFMDATFAHKPLCHVISRFEKELLTVKQEIERRTTFIHDIAELKEIMEEQEDLIKSLEEKVKKLSSRSIVSEALPTPAALVMKDYMMDDPNRETRMKEEKELVNNVSNLIAKVEEVENMTSKVQEELKSERRVRRHLEEDLNETRFSIKMLDDKLLNVTLPMDSRVTHVEEVVLSSLESMNKTLFEDHLKKLYYKVDGIVYKNETEKLDERLDQVEMELMDANNMSATLKFVEELNNLTDILSTMNQTIMGKFSEEESRLSSLENKTNKLDDLEVLGDHITILLNKTSKLDGLEELQDQMANLLLKATQLDEVDNLKNQLENLWNKTTKLDELESLQEQMTVLFNDTKLMQNQAKDLWMDMQNLRNTTVQLENEFYNQSSMTNKTLATVQEEITGQLQTLAEDLSSLESDVTANRISLFKVKTNMNEISANLTVTLSKVGNLTSETEMMKKEISTKIENLTGVWDNSLSILASQIEQWKNSKDADSFKNITETKNTDEWKESDDDGKDEVNLGRLRLKESEEQLRCDLPSINDEHLLMTMEEDSHGLQTLVFGCRPIGLYVLEEGSVPLQCKDGFWHGSFPTCTGLKTEAEIIGLTKELQHPPNPCLKEDGDVPDIKDCSYFYKCANGISHGREICPPGLRFDVQTRRCEWSNSVKCASSLDMEGEKLEGFIPTILIEPDNVDKPFGLMSTNDKGHLIVYPNTNFKLHCLFPENQLGSPTWMAEQFSSGFEYPASSRNLKHRSTVEFNAISSRFSGIYTCKTPYNKKNSITIVVEAVTCPPFQVDSTREKALTYNSHPDGGQRILSTTAQFFCEDGSSITAMCLPTGNWSRPAPTVAECPPKRAKIWGCDVFIKQTEDDPEVRYDNFKHEIRFSCPDNRRLVGESVATCIKNSWTISTFPFCQLLST